MYQYAKKVLNETVEEGKQRKSQKELKEKDEINKKIVAITRREKKLLRKLEIIEKYYRKNSEKEQFCEEMLNEFLNEKIDYSNIHLEVNSYEKNIHKNCGKKLIKSIKTNM